MEFTTDSCCCDTTAEPTEVWVDQPVETTDVWVDEPVTETWVEPTETWVEPPPVVAEAAPVVVEPAPVVAAPAPVDQGTLYPSVATLGGDTTPDFEIVPAGATAPAFEIIPAGQPMATDGTAALLDSFGTVGGSWSPEPPPVELPYIPETSHVMTGPADALTQSITNGMYRDVMGQIHATNISLPGWTYGEYDPNSGTTTIYE